VTLLDLLLLGALALSVAAGHRTGLLVRLAGLGGVVGGLALAVLTVPVVLRAVPPVTAAGGLAVAVATVAVTVLLTMVVLQVGAFRLRGAIVDERVRALDRLGGAVVGATVALALVWLAAPLAGVVPGRLGEEVRRSTVVAVVEELTPTAPTPAAALRTLAAGTPFPELLAGVTGSASAPPPTAVTVPRDVVTTAASSAVKLEATGCGVLSSGSGWVVAPGLVVTNAHVVAGSPTVLVRRPDGSRLDGEVVAHDAGRDLALVRVEGLGLAALPRGRADAGEDAATFGHPLGREQLRVAPARVEGVVVADGRSGGDGTDDGREVVVLAAELALGDSGSAVVDADGTVVGTVFAVSPTDLGTAYAIADTELAAVLAAPRVPGDAGDCD
jgi:S1-C subfamily serine protease